MQHWRLRSLYCSKCEITLIKHKMVIYYFFPNPYLYIYPPLLSFSSFSFVPLVTYFHALLFRVTQCLSRILSDNGITSIAAQAFSSLSLLQELWACAHLLSVLFNEARNQWKYSFAIYHPHSRCLWTFNYRDLSNNHITSLSNVILPPSLITL